MSETAKVDLSLATVGDQCHLRDGKSTVELKNRVSPTDNGFDWQTALGWWHRQDGRAFRNNEHEYDIVCVTRNGVQVTPATAEPVAEELDALRDALWVCMEHNRLHHGPNHNTVIQAEEALQGWTPPPTKPVRTMQTATWEYAMERINAVKEYGEREQLGSSKLAADALTALMTYITAEVMKFNEAMKLDADAPCTPAAG